MSLPVIAAITAMISATGLGYPVYEVLQDVSSDDLPCVVLNLKTVEYLHTTTTGNVDLILLDKTNANVDHRENIKTHLDKLYDLQEKLKQLPQMPGYLVDPKYEWTQEIERIGDTAEVTDTDLLFGYITIQFGLSGE